jgi:hypothetical protein
MYQVINKYTSHNIKNEITVTATVNVSDDRMLSISEVTVICGVVFQEYFSFSGCLHGGIQ